MMKLPFGTITISPMSKRLIGQALDSARVSSGRMVGELERKFAELTGANHAVAVATGTDADTLALAMLHDFGAVFGDEVIVPALSFVATGNSVLHARLKPKFVDIERGSLNIDISQIEKAITDRTRAILPVHLMGKPAEMDAIMKIAEKHGLWVVEDAAEAHGMRYRSRPAGSLGHLGAFSLYIAHIVTTIEGGMITCRTEEQAEILRSLRAHGRACSCVNCKLSASQDFCEKRFDPATGEDLRFTFPRIGYSCKMNELEAAVGLGNLAIYHEILEKRYANLKHVLDRFDRFTPYLSTIREEPWERIGPHAIPIVINEQASFTRSQLTAYLEQNGIETRTLFQSMPTQCPGFAYLGYHEGQFPVAEYMSKNGIHIGCHHDLTIEHMDYFLDHLEKFLSRFQR